MDNLMIEIKLPPGLCSEQIIEKFLQLTLNQYKWLVPNKYGHIDADIKIDGSCFDKYKKDLINLFQEYHDLCLSKGKNYLIFTPDERMFLGDIYYITTKMSKIFEINSHNRELCELIRLFKSPLAISAAKDMYDKYQLREIQKEGYTEETYTVKDYTCGLQNAFWRMWFGKEYIEFFGKERLDKAPAFFKQYDYETGIYFVQLFESPYDWNTTSGITVTENFKDAVGRDAFYDPDNPEKKLKAPDFSHLIR